MYPYVYEMCNEIVTDQGAPSMSEEEFAEWLDENSNTQLVGESGQSYVIANIIDEAEKQLAGLTPEMREFIALPTEGEDEDFYAAIPGAPYTDPEEIYDYAKASPAGQVADAFFGNYFF